MCSRFDQAKEPDGVAIPQTSPRGKYPRYNIGIGDTAIILLHTNAGVNYCEGRFGVQTSYGVLYNARLEGDLNPDNNTDFQGPAGIFDKPAYARLIRHQRCAIPVTGFYEGPKDKGLREPYHFRLPGEACFWLGGLYQTYRHPKTQAMIQGFIIITMAALPVTAQIGHHRCPFILQNSWVNAWLHPHTPPSDIEYFLLHRYDPGNWQCRKTHPAYLKERNQLTGPLYIN
ncbi:MAG: SOS response-associated peptidase [Chitinophagales bacterium]|nr:SOS response-associated peptidase [Chitinophagales bacterium]MDW8419089.1 SOS response-associated peptidase family protein [Chitinophagales bacterium]